MSQYKITSYGSICLISALKKMICIPYQYIYPLVNVDKKLWSITMLSIGKSTISNGHSQ